MSMARALCCGDCTSLCGWSNRVGSDSPRDLGARLSYLILLALMAVVMVYLLASGAPLFDRLPMVHAACMGVPAGSEHTGCVVQQALQRAGLPIQIIFLLLLLLLLLAGPRPATGSLADTLHHSLWPVKALLLIAVGVAALFLPPVVLLVAGVLTYPPALFFVLLQLVLLVDFAYYMNDVLVKRADSSQRYTNAWLALNLALSAALLLATFGMVAYVYYVYTVRGCVLGACLVTGTVFASLAVLGVGLFSRRGSLLTSAMVMSYSVYTSFSALQNPRAISATCAMNARISSGSTTVQVIGLVALLVSVLYSTLTTSGRNDALVASPGKPARPSGRGSKSSAVPDGVLAAASDSSSDGQAFFAGTEAPVGAGDADDEAEPLVQSGKPESYVPHYMHLVYFCSSCYILLLFLGWRLDGYVPESQFSLGTSRVGFWLTLITGWVGLLLYIWSLLAPHILSNRVFE